MSTISDLSPGNKLSLKGKLFELQKKLTLLEIIIIIIMVIVIIMVMVIMGMKRI